jgi:hypothetical protein
MRRIGFQRALDEFERLAAQPASRRAERIGVIGKEICVVGNECHGAIERARRLGVTVHRIVGAREHYPAVDVAGFLFELGREIRRHRLDLLRRHFMVGGTLGVARRHRRKRVVIAQRDVQQERRDRNGAAQDRRGPCRRLRRGARDARNHLRLLEHPLLELALRLFVLIAWHCAGDEIGVELAELVTQDRDVGGFARNACRFAALQKGHQDPREGCRHHRGGNEHECGHERSFPLLLAKSRAARSCSSAVSGGASASPRRARKMRTRPKIPSSSSSAGPAQSSAVVALTGGW